MIKTEAIKLTNGGSTPRFTILEIELLRDLVPSDLIELSQHNLHFLIDSKKGVILNGRAPVWLYGFLVHSLHATAWIATNDPRLGAVVVESHTPNVITGDVINWKSELFIV